MESGRVVLEKEKPYMVGETGRDERSVIRTGQIYLARLARLERATYGLEVRCSIQLSYRRPFF